MLRKFHLYIGVFGFVAFVLQGQYMAIGLNELTDTPDGLRMLYRSSHLYLMFCAALNIVYGLRPDPHAGSLLSNIVSGIILISPLLMLAEFFFGADNVAMQRPFAFWTAVSVFAAVSLSVAKEIWLGWKA